MISYFLRTLFLSFFVILGLGACAPIQSVPAAQSGQPATSMTYVLVHGAFQDSSAWSEVVPLLEAQGHKVMTVDLPGRGGDPTPPSQITLDHHRDAVIHVINAQAGKVILVGHSFGGITISLVAEAIPEKIEALVFVAAYLPVTGDSLASLAAQDQGNAFTDQNFMIAPDYSTAEVLAADVVKIFCNDCTADFQKRTQERILPEPLGAMNTPVTVTAENFGRVRKVYVETLQDNAVSNLLQKLMLQTTPVDKVVTLDTGHMPFFSDPAGLVAALTALN